MKLHFWNVLRQGLNVDGKKCQIPFATFENLLFKAVLVQALVPTPPAGATTHKPAKEFYFWLTNTIFRIRLDLHYLND